MMQMKDELLCMEMDSEYVFLPYTASSYIIRALVLDTKFGSFVNLLQYNYWKYLICYINFVFQNDNRYISVELLIC
jgi:hypothetical protein